MRRRRMALVLALVVGALAVPAGPALAQRASGVCGGVESHPGSNNCISR